MASAASKPLIGERVLGGYEIVRKLGSGGMGSVYVAEHKSLSRKVAVKVLHDHMSTRPTIVSRFLAEARAASALSHPNIVEVLDAGKLSDGIDYIALEYLDGDGLDQYLKDRGGSLGLLDTLKILAQVSCGLDAAHEAGIIHRDLKLANLFVAPTTLNPLRTKILDFGVAKLIHPDLAGSFETKSQAVAGTPGYMAPEQARDMKKVDCRADVYSLGCIAYRLLSGRLPFEGDTFAEIIYRQLAEKPADIRALRPEIPSGWGDAIMAALSVEPDERPSTAGAFALDLARSFPGGIAAVREVAPLLARREGPTIERTPPYDPLENQTTLGISSRVVPTIPVVTKRRWLPGVIVATALVAAVAVVAIVAGSSAGPSVASAPDAGTPDATAMTPVDAAPTFVPSVTDAAIMPIAIDAASPDAQPTRERERRRTEKAASGRVRLEVSPWAEVLIRGKRVASAPTTITLPAGRHRVTLRNTAAGKSETISVKVKSGRTTVIKRKWD